VIHARIVKTEMHGWRGDLLNGGDRLLTCYDDDFGVVTAWAHHWLKRVYNDPRYKDPHK